MYKIHDCTLHCRCGLVFAGLVGAYNASNRWSASPYWKKLLACCKILKIQWYSFLEVFILVNKFLCMVWPGVIVRGPPTFLSVESAGEESADRFLSFTQFQINILGWSQIVTAEEYWFQIWRHCNIAQTKKRCIRRKCLVTDLLRYKIWTNRWMLK